MQEITLGELASSVGGRVVGNPDRIITSAATLEAAGEGQISFLSNIKYTNKVKTTQASAVVIAKECESSADLIVVDDPYFAFRQIVVKLHGHRKHKQCGHSPKASIDPTAEIGSDTHIQDFAYICENVKIGSNCIIYPHVYIGPGTTIGDNCILYPNAVIFDNCVVGNRVIIQANATVGEDGFGFATHKGQHHKIPHIGRAILEDDVEIGTGCGIERGTLDDTIIGKGAKIGDLVAIGHGTKVGAGCLIVAQVGIAGSTTIGQYCVLGGQVGVNGHIKLGNMVTVGAKSGVINDVPDGKVIMGQPAIEAGKAKRAYSVIEYLPELKSKVRRLEKTVARLEAEKGESQK